MGAFLPTTIGKKAPRIVTHYKKFDAEAAPVLADFYVTVREGLRAKLGPIVFKLPPEAAYAEELLSRILWSSSTLIFTTWWSFGTRAGGKSNSCGSWAGAASRK